MAVIGTFGSFTAARLGIYASQASLNVTGNNIANINTKGYIRQRMDLYSLNSTGSPRYANSFNVDIGYGVLSNSVSQLRDPYLDILYRNEQSGVGAYEARLDGLNQLSHILDEVGKGDGEFGILEAQFNDLLKQLQLLSRNAGSEEYDTTVRGSAKTLCQYFNSYAKSLSKTKDTLTENLQGDVKTVNTILTQIRDLNTQIREAGIHGDNALELRDARNVLIDDLSSYMKIDVRYSMEKIDEYKSVEKLTISIANTGTPPIELINGIYGTQLSMPEKAAKRNPDYDPTQPTACRYIHQDSTTGNVKYTNELRYAMRMPGGKPVTNDGAGETYLRTLKDAGGKDIFPGGLTAANFYDATQPSSGKYLKEDGTGTDNYDEAELVDNAKLGSDDNRLWMQLAPLTDEKGRYMKDGNYKDITEPVDLGDNTLYGSLQSLREILVEEGEFASEDDLKFDENANIKRGIPYYQHALDALAKKFAETMNKANTDGPPDYNKVDIIGADGKKTKGGGVLFSNRGDGDGTEKITAANISISKSWATGANRILSSRVNDELSHSTDNDNIRHILTLMGTDMEYKPQDIEDIIDDPKNHAASRAETYFKGTFQDMLTNFNNILAADRNTTQTQYNSYSTKALVRDNDRTSVSGVDLNDEATNMMQFQKSYSAACQLMTTLDSMLDKLINGTLR